MVFAWDENKNRINRRKHGISFETAARIFGCAGGIAILLVVHTSEEPHGEEEIRIPERAAKRHLCKKGEFPRARSLPRLSLTSSAANCSGSQPAPIHRSTSPMRLKEVRGRPKFKSDVSTGQSSSW
jgi:hypothetical protein